MEMNLHMPQDVEAETELRNLAAVPYQIISPANNSPIIGIYQDSMLGCNRFTRKGIKFNPRDAMNLLMMFSRIDERKLTKEIEKGEVSNFHILSQILPPMSLKYPTKLYKDEEKKTSNNILEIKNGEYLRGQMEKGVLGGGSKSMIQRICNDFGNYAAANFVDDLQNIITEYMKSSAYSVGIDDLIANKETKQKIIDVITGKKVEVKNLIDKTQIGIFENKTGKTNEEEFETQVNNILNKAANEAGKIGLNSLSRTNRFVIMVNAGSKGSDLNISQMISCLGQQNVDGKRIPYGFDHRTLPHFTKFDDSPSARGFVESSYINGLSPQELFFHAMGGRVGLIDTAVKTSTTGYIQRRLIKGLEDLMVSYDMTVRTNKNKVVQFIYGDDGVDTVKVEKQSIPLVKMSIQDIYSHYNVPYDTDSVKSLKDIMTRETFNKYKKELTETNKTCKYYTDLMIQKRDEIIKCIFKYKDDSEVYCPVAFNYIIGNIQNQMLINSNSQIDITFLEAFEMINKTLADLEKIYYVPPNDLFKTLFYFYLSPKELLFIKRFNKLALIMLLNKITLDYKRSIVAPGEMVGMISAQSIGEPTTQLTLNSVTYETEIIVRDREGSISKIQIGEYVDQKINIASKKEYYKDKDTYYAELDSFYEIPSCDDDGNISWKRIEAVTKHPVINEDGSNTMLKITTEEEREVYVTKAKGILKLIDGKIIGINGDQLKVGDYLPVSKKQIDFQEKQVLNLKEILSPKEYIYTSEVNKAKSVMNEKHWWSSHNNKTFVLPYKRSDSFVSKMSEKLRNGCKSKTSFTDGCVYTKQTNKNNYTIPENIELDYNFGYLIGAYSAEGCMTKTQISIANNDADYFQPILELCNKWNITTKVYRHENKNQEGWTSQDLRIYNTLLCRLLEIFCGKLSHNKFVSDKIIFSNKECLMGFLDAYIGGDGCIEKTSKKISMHSVSKNLLMDVQQICNILGIYSYIKKPSKQLTNNRGSLDIKQGYNLFITGSQLHKLASKLNIKIKDKQNKLKLILDHTYQYNIHKNDTIIPNEINGELVIQERPHDKYTELLFDKVKSIEMVPNTTNYAYDLTIETTRIFNLYNGLPVFDTFHFAGVSSKSNVTRGVPRIEEILSLSSEPKNPSLTIFLKPEDEDDRTKAQCIMYNLEYTKMIDLVSSIEICFEPNDITTSSEDFNDDLLLQQYNEFEKMIQDCNGTNTTQLEKSKWLLRMEMNSEMMLEKNITMDDIHFTLKNSFGNEISCIFSDYNSDNLIFRIRMNQLISQTRQSGKIALKKVTVDPLDQHDQIYKLKNFQEQILSNTIIRGVKNINKVILRKIKDNISEQSGIYKKKDIWVLDTIGTNLLDVLALEYLDNKRTFSNDIMEIYSVLGIEAARQTIYVELSEVLEFDGGYINYHHMAMLCDRMTYSSKLISIFRHGINNDNIGPIAKASFEETPEMFLKAAKHGELDIMRGISANVMVGQEGLFGTSAFQVILNTEEMKKIVISDKGKNKKENYHDIMKTHFEHIEDEESECSASKLKILNNVMNIKFFSEEEVDDDYDPEGF
jgi:DNA-directed RNA polymerase beta' subunit